MNNSSRLSRLCFLLLAVVFSLLPLTACHKKAVPLIKHAPVQNPQGIAFNTDLNFVKAYDQYLANKARLEYASYSSAENTNAEASIYNIKDIDHLRGAKIINPTEANWNVNYIAPQERHADKVIKKLKNFMDTGVQNVKNIVASPNSTNTTGNTSASNNKNKNNNNNRVINRNSIFHSYDNKNHNESREVSAKSNNSYGSHIKLEHRSAANLEYNRGNKVEANHRVRRAEENRSQLNSTSKDISADRTAWTANGRKTMITEGSITKKSVGHSARINRNVDNNARGAISLAKNEKSNINISKTRPHVSIKQATEKKSWQPWHEAALKNSEFFMSKKKVEPKLVKSRSNNEVLDLKKEFTSLKTETGKRIVDCRHGKEIIAKKI